MMKSTTTRVAEILTGTFPEGEVRVKGWVRTRRDSKGGFSFIELNDGSCLKSVQVVADGGLDNYDSEVLKLTTGCCVDVRGTVVASPGKGQSLEIIAKQLHVLGWADPETYPLQKKRHSYEYLRGVAHLRARTNTFGAVARIRSVLSDACHQFFQERGFVLLHTPIITGSDCEGAGAMFRVTTSNAEVSPGVGPSVEAEDFFGKSAYLTVSGQLEAETYAMALGRVYTFGPTFRAENSNTSRHLAEFWMVEPEMAFFDLSDDADLAEAFVKHLAGAVLERCSDDLDLFRRFVQSSHTPDLRIMVDEPFERITYTEAVDLLLKSGERFDTPVEWGTDLQSEHERYLAETVFKRPLILTDYPKDIKPFYMRVNDDGRTVAAMDVLVAGIGEIIGGGQREERYDVLVNRMKELGMELEPYWWYLDLRSYGTAPHAGFGLGFDRMVQFVTGMANIRDVIPFPRTPGNVEF